MSIGPAQSPTLVIQEAIFARANTDPGLAAFGADVFDYVPEDAPRPYIVVGDSPFTTTPDNTHSGFGWITVITLSIWIEERGFKLAHQIKNQLIALFDHQPLDLAPFHHVVTKHELDQELRDKNPLLRRSQLRLRVESEQERT